MTRPNFARRQFLRGAGVVVALPFLEAFAPRAARASAPTPPKRILFYVHRQGTVPEAWLPSATGPLGTLPDILSPLQAFKDDLLVLSGINNTVAPGCYLAADGHQATQGSMMTCQPFVENVNSDGSLKSASEQVGFGQAAGPSIDQVLAQRIGSSTQFRSLNVGFGQPSWFSRSCFAASADPVMVDVDPKLIHERLFSNLDEGDDTEPTPLERLRAQRKSVLDAVSGGLSRINAQLGGEDRQRLEAHADKIRELEKSLDNGTTPGVGCSKPVLTLPGDYDPGHSNYDHISSPITNMQMAMALACDVTRVITIEHLDFHGPLFPFIEGINMPGEYTEWHAMVHEGMNGAARPTIQRVIRWYSEQFADLLQRLKDTPEGESNMLDHTLVVWLSDFGDGSTHTFDNIPIVLAGRLGGAVSPGQHISCQGRSMGDLFTSILHLMGQDDATFGRPEFCNGPIPGLG